MKQVNLLTKGKQIHRLREWTYGYQGERKVWKFGIGMYTALYLIWITNKDLQYSTENSAQCYVAAWMRGECGGECIHIYIWLSLFAVHLKLSHLKLLIGYIPIQNKTLKKTHVKKKKHEQSSDTMLWSPQRGLAPSTAPSRNPTFTLYFSTCLFFCFCAVFFLILLMNCFR